MVNGPFDDDLSLEGDYFEFQGNTAPATVLAARAEHVGTIGEDYIFSSTVDDGGNLYVGGGTTGSLERKQDDTGSRDAWLSKYDEDGQLEWTSRTV